MTNDKMYDVIVAGGGSAGISAATQSSLAGAKTLLVEKSGMLGGTTTVAGVNYPGLFHAWGKQVIAGIGWNIVAKTVDYCGETLPDFADYKRPHHLLQVRVNPFVYAALCDEAVVDSGADILFHAMPGAVEHVNDAWSVTVCTKDGLSEMTAKVLIDCTADANVVGMAGFELRIPDETQPATLSCIADGYDLADLDLDAINAAFDAEVKAGRLSYADASWNTTGPNVGQWLRAHGANANHTHHINARDSEGKTRLELESRKAMLRLYRFLKTQPGLENLVIRHICSECGVRETATIVGKATVTVEDYQTGRLFPDAVCHGFYPVDLHKSSEGGLRKEELSEGTVPSVPRGALLPDGSQNLLVGGRCLSSDRLANSGLRVQATCMATGQAAGAMAAISARTGTDPESLEMSEIRELLREHGAVVPGE